MRNIIDSIDQFTPVVLNKNYVFVKSIERLAKSFKEHKKIYHIGIQTWYGLNNNELLNAFKEFLHECDGGDFKVKSEFYEWLDDPDNLDEIGDSLRELFPNHPSEALWVTDMSAQELIKKSVCPGKRNFLGLYLNSALAYEDCKANATTDFFNHKIGKYIQIFGNTPLCIEDHEYIEEVSLSKAIKILYNFYKNNDLDSLIVCNNSSEDPWETDEIIHSMNYNEEVDNDDYSYWNLKYSMFDKEPFDQYLNRSLDDLKNLEQQNSCDFYQNGCVQNWYSNLMDGIKDIYKEANTRLESQDDDEEYKEEDSEYDEEEEEDSEYDDEEDEGEEEEEDEEDDSESESDDNSEIVEAIEDTSESDISIPPNNNNNLMQVLLMWMIIDEL